MAKVFVSYSRKDIVFAKQLTAELQKSEMDFWIDWEGIPPTVDWWREIEKGIEESDVFLFLISPDSSASRVCGKEIDTAVRNAKRIIPLVVRDVKSGEAPGPLSHLNWIFFRESDDFSAALQKLLTAIQTDYEWAATHRRLQVKALDWERNNKETGFLLRGADLLDAEQDLATNTSKEPHPTDLQREYVFESRKATDRQRRFSMIAAVAAVVALAALAVFGFAQAKTASERAEIALARQLAIEAEVLPESQLQIAVMLAVESMAISPSVEPAEILLTNSLPFQISGMEHHGVVNSAAFHPDGTKVVSSGCDKYDEINVCIQGSARVWNVATGKEIASMIYEGEVYTVIFSPDGKYVASEGCDQRNARSSCIRASARVWDAGTGMEISRMQHDGWIQSIAFSPDGKYVISGSEDTTARVWEAITGKEVSHIPHDSEVMSVAFTPDSQYALSGSANGAISIWDLAENRESDSLDQESILSSLAVSADGKFIASASGFSLPRELCFGCGGGGGGLLKIWDLVTKREIFNKMLDDSSSINSVAFSPDGTSIAAASDDSAIHIWDTATGDEIAILRHDGPVTSVSFSYDGKQVVSGSLDNTARVWDISTREEVARMTHNGRISSVEFSPDKQHILSSSYDKTALVWALDSEEKTSSISEFDNYLYVADVSSNGEHIVSSSICTEQSTNGYCVSYEVTVLAKDSPKDITHVSYAGQLYSSDLSPDGKYIVLGGCEAFSNTICTQGSIEVEAIDTGTEVVRMVQNNSVNAVAFSPDGKRVLSGGNDHTVRIWDATNGAEIVRVLQNQPALSVAFNLDGAYFGSEVCMEYDKELPHICKHGSTDVWETTTGNQISHIEHNERTDSVIFSPDGKQIVTTECARYAANGACLQGLAYVWMTTTGKEAAKLTHNSSVLSLAFSPNGRFIVSGGHDHATRVWEVAKGKEVNHWTHDSVVRSVAFSPDGNYVASGGDDGIVHVWEIITGKELARMNHNEPIRFVRFSKTGESIVSIDPKKSITWEWQPADLIAGTCLHLRRNLNRDEWQKYIGDLLPYPKKQADAACPQLPLDAGSTPTPAP